MNALWRLVITVLAVTTVALWPMGAWRWQVLPLIVLACLTGLTRLPLGSLLRRLAVVWLLAGLMALGLAGQDQWLVRAGNLLVKSTLSVWSFSLLTHTTPMPDLIRALRRLGLSQLWTDSLAFWSRYYAVLADEWQRMQLARRARTMTHNRQLQFRALASGLGVLFVRAYERAEQVHQAMLARGYRGGATQHQNPAAATSAATHRH